MPKQRIGRLTLLNDVNIFVSFIGFYFVKQLGDSALTTFHIL